MIRSTRILSSGSYDPAQVLDVVQLDFDDRRRRRGTLTGMKGAQFLVDLAEAPTLQDGDAFVLDQGGLVRVEAKPERLVEFRSDNPDVILRVAWHLGNRHTPTQLLGKALRIRDDYVLVEMVKKLGAEVGFVDAPFQPEGGAYGHGTVRGHDDAHGHASDHEHHHGHDHAQAAVAPPAAVAAPAPAADGEEARLMAEAVARREARKAARAAKQHVHGPDCGHDHDHDHHHGHDHGHEHAHPAHAPVHDDAHHHDHEHHHDHDDHEHSPDCGHHHDHQHAAGDDHSHGHEHDHHHDKPGTGR
ncbi:MAG: urease accessory protein UreE [Ancalomicrobiaceae bacterium]|nr:urease accessory protein UreE [Ancalomicrobiaceae bacterium]